MKKTIGIIITLFVPLSVSASEKFVIDAKLFTNRDYTLLQPPSKLAGKPFLCGPLGVFNVECAKGGKVWALTRKDGSFSAAEELLATGFTQTGIPEFTLFGGDRVVVFEKTMAAGERFTMPKWGVMVESEAGMLKAAELPPEPPMIFIGEVPDKYALSGRLFQGISSLAVAPNGRIWANWYANSITAKEDKHNYVVGATSMDNGESWTEKVIVDPDWIGSERAFDPELWIAANGKLWFFWSQSCSSGKRVWAMTTRNLGDDNPVWSKPRCLTKGVMMCKPIVLSSGEWVLPVSVWSVNVDSAKMVVSADEGKTWTVRGGANVSEEFRAFDEHVIIEKKDGSLQMFRRVRSQALKATGETAIWQSVSNDRGKTWTEASPWIGVKSPSSRFMVKRLQSGRLLLIKYGLAIDSCTGRRNLSAWLSDDDGITWKGGLILDERFSVSYPDGMQGADGTIYITSDHKRIADREIVMARFTEQDILAGKLVNPKSKLKMVISKP